jgi:CxxC motif-containing protein (DUF1111 family)
MATRSRIRPAYLVVAALVIPPAYKVAEWAMRPGPKQVNLESAAAGKVLFNHEWTVKDPLAGGDGLGPVFNATSCLDCHNQGGPGGGGPVEKNVTVYGVKPHVKTITPGIPHIGVVHQKAVRPEFQERLSQVAANLPGSPSVPLEKLNDQSFICTVGTDVTITQRNTPALFGDGQLDMIPEDDLHAAQRRNSTAARLVGLSRAKDPMIRGRVARLPDGRLGRFGWKAEFATLNEFVKAACANEIGLSNPDRPQATPLGRRDYKAPANDLTAAQCEKMTDFIRALDAPTQVKPTDPKALAQVDRGEQTFSRIGCADCHTPDLGPIKGFYSNLLLHDLGGVLAAGIGSYGEAVTPPNSTTVPVAPEWKTPPLWGVADSAPYLHDGRATTLEDAIIAHGGESSGVTDNFKALKTSEQQDLVAFLKTLRAPASAADPSASPSRSTTRTASR